MRLVRKASSSNTTTTATPSTPPLSGTAGSNVRPPFVERKTTKMEVVDARLLAMARGADSKGPRASAASEASPRKSQAPVVRVFSSGPPAEDDPFGGLIPVYDEPVHSEPFSRRPTIPGPPAIMDEEIFTDRTSLCTGQAQPQPQAQPQTKPQAQPAAAAPVVKAQPVKKKVSIRPKAHPYTDAIYAAQEIEESLEDVTSLVLDGWMEEAQEPEPFSLKPIYYTNEHAPPRPRQSQPAPARKSIRVRARASAPPPQ